MKKILGISVIILGFTAFTVQADDSWRISRLESEIYRLDSKTRDLEYDIWDLERDQDNFEQRLQTLESKPALDNQETEIDKDN